MVSLGPQVIHLGWTAVIKFKGLNMTYMDFPPWFPLSASHHTILSLYPPLHPQLFISSLILLCYLNVIILFMIFFHTGMPFPGCFLHLL